MKTLPIRLNLLTLAWAQLWSRPLATVLNWVLLALGVTALSLVILIDSQVEQALQRDVQGIDLVVGAKGSPLQLILAGVYHLDVPTGNIPLAAVAQMRTHPLVESVIPLSLGDSLAGFRIVGTEPAYLDHYGLKPTQGRLWAAPLEAVLGADVATATGLRPGQRFVGSHGLGGGGDEHAEAPYTVVGVLPRSGTVLDRLVLTGLESVWAVHEAAHGGASLDAEDRAALAEDREVTLLLLHYRTPLAAVTLPRAINSGTAWQAASPAVEMSRLGRLIGVGAELMQGFGAALLLVAGLSVFVGLWHAVRERLPDLAMLRMLGARPHQVALLVLCEALWLALLGLALGLLLAQGLTAGLGHWLALQRSVAVSGWVWPAELWIVPAGTLVVALGAAALPARSAYRLDVTTLLQAPH